MHGQNHIKFVSDKVVEKIKTHVLCSVTFLEYNAVFEVWKNSYSTAG